MKRWVYISGFLFLALLLGLTAFKVSHQPIPDALFYVFCMITAVFFFLLIFSALRQKKS